MSLPDLIERAIVALVVDLSQGRFAKIANDGRVGRLTAQELECAISEYGGTLISLPPDAFTQLDVYPLEDEPQAWAIDVPLWTSEEGRSDLTLSITARLTESGPELEIDDVHVL